jgi:pimeloyl-ACP methyl ester carboxylesterase
MNSNFNVLWLNASPSLKHFDRPLIQYLSKYTTVALWEYKQSKDEGSYLDKAIVLLYDFFKTYRRPVHLAGHGISGVVALVFARKYPKRVKSLTLISVAGQPANTWHAHYYVQRQLFNLNQDQVLASNVRSLFGSKPPYSMNRLITALARDLEESPHPHSLFNLVNMSQGGVSMPMMVCGSKTDPVVNTPALHHWRSMLKTNDIIWECSEGYHFFHYFYPELVGDKMLSFWLNQQQGISICDSTSNSII